MEGTTPSPIAFTPGEPAGIGPDLAVMLAQQSREAALVAVADPELLEARAVRLDLPLHLVEYGEGAQVTHQPGSLSVLPVTCPHPVDPGRLDPANAPYVLHTLRLATRRCMQREFAALVTGPVHKGVINDAGQPFTGHTEFLAELTGGDPLMMLAAPGLRVALVTTHLPLAGIAAAITPDRIERIVRILHRELHSRYGIERPRILVSGLNPHAGEGGHLGREEIEVIEPTLDRLRGEGIDLTGPLPADTLFTPPHLERADVVLAMYHDQGLPVLKHLGFGRAVNITLGLPIIRTSVDHGTALDLAGTGQARSGSLEAAIAEAMLIIRRTAAIGGNPSATDLGNADL